MTLNNIQALRALAAYMVVVFHLTEFVNQVLPDALDWRAGQAGVDVFFVISGFIMVFTTRRGDTSPADFLRRRVIRVVPLYWLVTGILVLCLIGGFAPFGLHDWAPGDVFRSLLFLPLVRVDGVAGPPLGVGWTLNYEMFFYVLFALTLALRRQLAPALGISLAIGLLVAGAVLLPPHTLAGSFYSSPIMLEFVAGALLGHWWSGRPPRTACAGPQSTALRAGGIAALALGAAGILAGDRWLLDRPYAIAPHLQGLPMADLYTDPWRALAYGLPATAIVAGALMLERGGWAVRNRLCLAQGDASYAVYLVHLFVLQLGFKLAMLLLPATVAGVTAAAAAVVIASGVLGWLLHATFELPVKRLLESLFSRRRAAAPVPLPETMVVPNLPFSNPPLPGAQMAAPALPATPSRECELPRPATPDWRRAQ